MLLVIRSRVALDSVLCRMLRVGDEHPRVQGIGAKYARWKVAAPAKEHVRLVKVLVTRLCADGEWLSERHVSAAADAHD